MRAPLRYSSKPNFPRPFLIKHSVKLIPVGQGIDLESVTFEATMEDVEFAETLQPTFSLSVFERLVDMFEKLTNTSEFMESFDNCLQMTE